MLFLAITTGATLVLSLLGLVLALMILAQQPWFQSEAINLLVLLPTLKPPAEPPAAPRVEYTGPRLSAADLTAASQFFVHTQVWEAHLTFTSNQWQQLAPVKVPRSGAWMDAEGEPNLRNPAARRPGVTGMSGLDQPWSTGDCEIGGVKFTNVAVRFKGNGTFFAGMSNYKRPFKIDLAKEPPPRSFAEQTTLNLHNLLADRSCISDALAYEFYRDAGVPAVRTTYARVLLTLGGRWENRLLGLYLFVENPDRDWVRARLGRGSTVFKPVTVHLFDDLGELWQPYEEIYSPRGKVNPETRRRLMDLCRLVTHAPDPEFAARLGDFVDLDQLATFIACEAMLSNFDGILNNGQNFLMWFDGRSEKFGFSPWDLDHSWGEFSFIGTAEMRERANALHPWLGKHRFFERIFAIEEFQQRYRRALTRLLDEFFVPARLHPRIDALADAIRPAVAQHGTNELAFFELAVTNAPPTGPRDGSPFDDAKRPVHRLKHFITVRAAEVRAQLEGKSEGVRIKR